jgi:extracellular elastinolytic metalloproteinase
MRAADIRSRRTTLESPCAIVWRGFSTYCLARFLLSFNPSPMNLRYLAVVALAFAPALASAQGLAPEAAVHAARAHLDRNQTQYGVTSTEISQLAVTDAYTSQGTSHVYFRQTVNGIEAVGTEVGVHLNSSGHVVHVAGEFHPGISQRSLVTSPNLSAAAAVGAVARDAGLQETEAFAVVERRDVAGRELVLSDGGVAASAPTANLVYYITDADQAFLTWEVVLEQLDGQHAWLAYVDASSGAVLYRTDLVVHDNFGPSHGAQLAEAAEQVGPWLFEPAGTFAPTTSLVGSYRVYPLPIESPNHVLPPAPLPPGDGRTLVANPDVAGGTASPFGWHDTNGAAGAEFTTTQGNNVHAYTDVDANGTPDAGSSPDGGAGLLFDFPLDLTQAPSAYRPAAVANLFYWNNIIHDVLWQYGFDEPSGNFRVNNYGRGGLGNDDVRAEAQDGSGTNNANFLTLADGQRPRMQMYIWTAPTPDRDGDVDNGIILHEFGHGVSNRLTGGPSNVSCLQNAEQMGEGWSDFFSIVMTWPPGQTRTTNRGVGTYALNQPTTGVGIRPAPYNTNFAVNNFTYQATRTQAVPHGVGFVWATILWEVYWDMVDQFGFSPDIYNDSGTAGNQIFLRLVMEGMKLQPCSPGFVDGRNAILAADVALYGGVHVDLLWEAFARRGLGFSASQGSSSTNSDNTEAFNTPEAVPPAAVTNLAVVPQGDFVNVTFTAVGDDGNVGTADTYDLRYRTSGPILTDGDFNAATQVTGEPDPQPAGSPESIMVSGLNFNTTYHFALKVADESANISPLSNPASGTTLGPPVFVPPAQNPIVANAPSGGMVTVPVTIGNTGASVLTYSVDLQEAPPAAPTPPADVQAELPSYFGADPNERKESAEVAGPEVNRGSGGPDAFGYRWIDSNEPGGPVFSWTNIVGLPGAVAHTLTDDASVTVALPFTFNYYGVPQNNVRIVSNGYLAFGGTSNAFTNTGIPNAAVPNNIVAAFWDDLNPSDGGTIHSYHDVAGNRFIVQWTNVPRFSDPASTMTFQIVLNASDSINFYYNTMNGTTNSATVGIEDNPGAIGLQIAFNTAYVQNSLAVRIAALWVSANVTTPQVPVGGTDTFDLVFDGSGLPDGTYHAEMTISTNDPANPSDVIDLTFNLGVVGNNPGAPEFEGTHLLTAVRPNPFDDAAGFTLALRDAGAVSIALFDALGRRVATVFDGELSARTAHAFTVDGRDLAAGAYVLRVEGDGFAESRRVTLVR